MLEGIFTVRNRLGLHARAAALFVKLAAKFHSNVLMEKDGMQVNGKSIMGLVMLAAAKDTVLTIECSGEGATNALDELCNLIENKFGVDS